MKTTQSGAALLATFASVALLAGCSSTDAVATDLQPAATALGSEAVAEQMDALYKTAQEEGQNSVVVYGPGEQLYTPAYETFMARYPDIQVTGEYIYGAELATRLDQEFSTGQHVGSLQTGGPAMSSASVAADRCSTYAPFSAEDIEGEYPVSEEGAFRALVGFPFVIAYNTDMISEDELPQKFTDLADPQFAGQYVLEDPSTTNGTANTLAQMYAAGVIDDEWLETVAAQEPPLRANSALTVQAVASGQAAFDPFGQYPQYLSPIAEGLPIDVYYPLTESRMEYHYSCVFNDAPNPEATELFYNWLYTPEGQDALSTTGVYGVRPGTSAPSGLPDLEAATADLIPSTPVSTSGATTLEFLDASAGLFK